MVETHPFGNFTPTNINYLFLGSFTGKPVEGYDWFFSNKRNQFWPIMEEVYGIKLNTKARKQLLFEKLRMAMADIILSCERKNNSNLDTNLINIIYNTKAIENIIQKNSIKKIFFSSRFTETLFNKQFKETIEVHPEINLVYLPSPSPRYATMNIQEKINCYKKLLPILK